MAGEGCAICGLALRGLRRYMEGLAYEAVNNIAIRAELRAARGFCAPHGLMLREVRSALGTAIIHRDIVGAAMGALESSGGGSGGGLLGRLMGGQPRGGGALAPQAGCPACAQRRKTEEVYLGTLAARIADAELRQSFDASAGLCLPHLRAALGRCGPAAFGQLKAAQLGVWGRLAGELDEFIRKCDHQFAHEEIGAEATSWSRASLLISGHPLLGLAHDEV
nr:DUF6062 family protein [Oscillochloris sp. ZM17-4]